MVETIGAASLLCGGSMFKDFTWRTKPLGNVSVDLRCKRVRIVKNGRIRALAMELTKEAYVEKQHKKVPDSGLGFDFPPNRADNPSLMNPLLRHKRMGCGWLGAIFEWEGVIAEDHPETEHQSWLALAREEQKSPPLAFVLKRIEGMKSEQAISEVLCWSRDPSETRRLALRKEEIHLALEGSGTSRLRSGSEDFVNVLMTYNIPMALVSTRPRKTLETVIGGVGIGGCFSVIVASEDVYRGKPDPEMFEYAARVLDFIPERCVVFGSSNLSIEAAHEAGMKCVGVASKGPVYELGAADLVVRRLDELSVVDLKNLADLELTEFGSGVPEPEVEREEEGSTKAVGTDEIFW